MEELTKTLCLAFSSIKGGVGKTIAVILLSRALASAGKRAMLIDSDLNNSLSFHFLLKEMAEQTTKLNFAAALATEEANLCDFAVPTKTENIDLIASSPYLSDLRGVNVKRLKRKVPALYGKYDVLIIDCHPTYDNIVLNALHAADYVITPVLKDLFSYNAAVFLSEVLPRDVEDLKNWFVLINGYDARYAASQAGRQSDFLKLYQTPERPLPLMPKETWLPWTSQIQQAIDYGKKLAGRPGIPGSVYHAGLYQAIKETALCFFDDLEIPEAF